MSRNGKKPISLGSTVKVDHDCDSRCVTVAGSLGTLSFVYPSEISLVTDGDLLSISPYVDNKRSRQMWGMTRAIIANMIEGVTKGFVRKMEIVGVGYRAQMVGDSLKMSLGYSHEIIFPTPKGVVITTPRPVEIQVSGIDRCLLGDVCARIRKFRPCEPYKGKGIRYEGERVFLKEGKKK